MAILIAAVFAGPAGAATIPVAAVEVAVLDNDVCSLIEAIHNANDNMQVDNDDCPAGDDLSGGDTIELSDSIYVVSAATGALPTIIDGGALTIEGAGATVRRDTSVNCFRNGTVVAGEHRIFDTSGATVTFRQLRIEEGCADGGFEIGSGGGLRINGGVVDLDQVTFDNSDARERGAAIFATGTPTVSLVDSAILNGLAEQGGGGIAIESGLLRVERSFFRNNWAYGPGGGAIFVAGGDAEVLNTTITENRADGDGGGILAEGDARLAFVTLVDNWSQPDMGGGIGGSGGTVISNSIIADSKIWDTRGSGNPRDCALTGALGESGINFDTDGTCEEVNQTTFQTVAVEDLDFEALADNGGVTQSLALGETSVAIDVIDPEDCDDTIGGSVTEDQRNVGRPRFGECDAGAYERDLAPSTALVGYWPFDEGSGLVTEDASKLSVDGELSGDDLWYDDAAPRGSRGTVLQFDGTGTGEVLIKDFLADLGAGDFTIALWFQIPNGNGGALLYKSEDDSAWNGGGGTGDKQLYFGDGSVGCGGAGDPGVNGGVPSFVGFGNDYLISDAVIADVDWHHWAITWEGDADGANGNGKVYIDGVEQPLSTSNYRQNLADYPDSWWIIGRDGSCEAGQGYDGRLDDLAIFNAPLNADQVEDVMNGDLSAFVFGIFKDGFELGNTTAWSSQVP